MHHFLGVSQIVSQSSSNAFSWWFGQATVTLTCVLLCTSLFPIGFYCPLGSFTPVPCPKGTYGLTAGAVFIDSCLKCPPHHYCPRPGLSASLPCGPVAQQPLSGQDTCVCPGEGQSFQVTTCFHMIVGSTQSYSMCVPSCVLMWPFHINTTTTHTCVFILWTPPLFYKPEEEV